MYCVGSLLCFSKPMANVDTANSFIFWLYAANIIFEYLEFAVCRGCVWRDHNNRVLPQIDNLIVVSDGRGGAEQSRLIGRFLLKYRRTINPHLLFVNIDLAGRVAA